MSSSVYVHVIHLENDQLLLDTNATTHIMAIAHKPLNRQREPAIEFVRRWRAFLDEIERTTNEVLGDNS